MRAGQQITLRPDTQVDDQADKARKHHQNHPQDGIIHATALRIARHPNQHRNVQGEECDYENAKEPQAAASGQGTGVVAALPHQKGCE